MEIKVKLFITSVLRYSYPNRPVKREVIVRVSREGIALVKTGEIVLARIEETAQLIYAYRSQMKSE